SISASCAFWKIWYIVKPKPISDSDVRITDINVRSALIRVRWKDMPVRRDDSSVEIAASVEFDVTRAVGLLSIDELLRGFADHYASGASPRSLGCCSLRVVSTSRSRKKLRNVRIAAMAASLPTSFQVGASDVLTMSAASWNVSAATSQCANWSQT